MGAQHIIELNGKRYDAVTGKMITDAPVATATSHTKSVSASPKKAMDGFSVPDKVARSRNSVPSHKTEKSKTLMRTVVHKPKPEAAAVSSETQQAQASKRISTDKLAHAMHIPKNALIRRFGNDMAAPKVQTAKAVRPTHITNVPSSTAGAQTDPLSRGLAQATGHKQTKVKRERRHVRLANRLKVSPRVLTTSSLALAGLLIAGFFAYQNMPNLAMSVATARSGVHGSLPGYHPAGFGLSGGITYKPGQITIGYKSNSDNRSFKITQQTSSWDSETLLQNYLATAQPITVPENGKTIYLYNDNNATWVDGGIWYRIEGQSKLNEAQLLNIADSL